MGGVYLRITPYSSNFSNYHKYLTRKGLHLFFPSGARYYIVLNTTGIDSLTPQQTNHNDTTPPRVVPVVVQFRVQSRKTYPAQLFPTVVGRTKSHEFRQRILESRNCAELVPAYQVHPPSAILPVLCGKTFPARNTALLRGQ